MNTLPPDIPREADTAVIGAGSGGAALAGTLAAHSTDTVLMFEAGPDYGSFAQGQWPDDVLSAKAIPLSHDWGTDHDQRPGPSPGPHGRRLLLAQRLHRLAWSP